MLLFSRKTSLKINLALLYLIAEAVPSYLLATLNEIKKEHLSIAKQVEELKETQNVFISQLLEDLKSLEEAEARLVAQVGAAPPNTKNNA